MISLDCNFVYDIIFIYFFFNKMQENLPISKFRMMQRNLYWKKDCKYEEKLIDLSIKLIDMDIWILKFQLLRHVDHQEKIQAGYKHHWKQTGQERKMII